MARICESIVHPSNKDCRHTERATVLILHENRHAQVQRVKHVAVEIPACAPFLMMCSKR